MQPSNEHKRLIEVYSQQHQESNRNGNVIHGDIYKAINQRSGPMDWSKEQHPAQRRISNNPREYRNIPNAPPQGSDRIRDVPVLIMSNRIRDIPLSSSLSRPGSEKSHCSDAAVIPSGVHGVGNISTCDTSTSKKQTLDSTKLYVESISRAKQPAENQQEDSGNARKLFNQQPVRGMRGHSYNQSAASQIVTGTLATTNMTETDLQQSAKNLAAFDSIPSLRTKKLSRIKSKGRRSLDNKISFDTRTNRESSTGIQLGEGDLFDGSERRSSAPANDYNNHSQYGTGGPEVKNLTDVIKSKGRRSLDNKFSVETRTNREISTGIQLSSEGRSSAPTNDSNNHSQKSKGRRSLDNSISVDTRINRESSTGIQFSSEGRSSAPTNDSNKHSQYGTGGPEVKNLTDLNLDLLSSHLNESRTTSKQFTNSVSNSRPSRRGDRNDVSLISGAQGRGSGVESRISSSAQLLHAANPSHAPLNERASGSRHLVSHGSQRRSPDG